jgi:hypothetical protein
MIFFLNQHSLHSYYYDTVFIIERPLLQMYIVTGFWNRAITKSGLRSDVGTLEDRKFDILRHDWCHSLIMIISNMSNKYMCPNRMSVSNNKWYTCRCLVKNTWCIKHYCFNGDNDSFYKINGLYI